MPKVGRVSVPYTALAHGYGCHHTPAQLLSAPNTLKTKENHTPYIAIPRRCRNHPFHCLTLLSEAVEKKAIRQTEHGQRLPLEGTPAPPSSTPKPLASASRRGYRNHPFHCRTLLSEPVKKKALRQTGHGQRMPLDGPPAPPSSTPKPLASASRRGYLSTA